MPPTWCFSARISTASQELALISYNPSLHQKHSGGLDGSDGPDRTSYQLMTNYMHPDSQAMGGIAYLPSLHCARNVVTYRHQQNDTCVELFAGATIML